MSKHAMATVAIARLDGKWIIMRHLVFLGIGFFVQWITAPHFLAYCSIAANPIGCFALRGGVILLVWMVLNALAGKKK